MELFPVMIRVHWVDTDAAGIVWFGNFLRFFEEAEDEAFRALGRTRRDLLADHAIFMPRVDSAIRYRSPARAGDNLEIGVGVAEVNERRLEWRFEILEESSRRLVAEGSYRVACVRSDTFAPRDFPAEIRSLVKELEPLARSARRG
jgi:YbgC/YbaW family acyl-CoA thioester hydrolase